MPTREQGRVQGTKLMLSTVGSVLGALVLDGIYARTVCDDLVNGSWAAQNECPLAGAAWWCAGGVVFLGAALCVALPHDFSAPPGRAGAGAAAKERGGAGRKGGGRGASTTDEEGFTDDDAESGQRGCGRCPCARPERAATEEQPTVSPMAGHGDRDEPAVIREAPAPSI